MIIEVEGNIMLEASIAMSSGVSRNMLHPPSTEGTELEGRGSGKLKSRHGSDHLLLRDTVS